MKKHHPPELTRETLTQIVFSGVNNGPHPISIRVVHNERPHSAWLVFGPNRLWDSYGYDKKPRKVFDVEKLIKK